MRNNELLSNTPLEGINCSFADYVSRKKKMLSAHMSGNGLPDYAYGMDYEYRKKLDAVPGLCKIIKRVLIPQIQKTLQWNNMQGILASPTQFSEIYQIGCDCAKVLGIGIPNIYIVPSIDGDDFNACAYAFDDQEPLILVTSLLIQRMTLGEVRSVIGHECGHIQNNHVIYQNLAAIIAQIGVNGLIKIPGISQLAGLLSTSVVALLNTWSRAAEVTADRASMLCCDSVENAYGVLKKFAYGGANIGDKVNIDLDLEALQKQLDKANESPYKIYEAMEFTHPISIRRIFATKEFEKCDLLYSWRPDLKKPGINLQSKKDTDEACKKIVGILKSKEGGK